MNNLWKIAAAASALSLAACGGESAANEAAIDSFEADTSRNWVEVVSETEQGGFVMGNPDAPIKIVEFASLTCSHCATFSEQGFEPLVEQYVSQGLVSFEIRNFVRDPLDLTAALLARCNGADPFFAINERLFANQNAMFEAFQGADQAQLQQIATPQNMQNGTALVAFAEAGGLTDLVGGLGISEQRARECLTDQAAMQELQQMRDRAVSQYNIPGTPAFLINGEMVENATTWAQLQSRIQELTR